MKTYICLHQVEEQVELPLAEWGRKRALNPGREAQIGSVSNSRKKIFFFYTVCSVNLNSHVHPSCTCPSVSIYTIGVTHQLNLPFRFDLHHRCHTPTKHAPMISTRYSKAYLIALTLCFEITLLSFWSVGNQPPLYITMCFVLHVQVFIQPPF